MSDGRDAESHEFEEPPAGTGQTPGDDHVNEDAGVEYQSPGDLGGQGESAAISHAPDALSAVDPMLLQIKGEIEDHLAQAVERASGAQSLAALQATGSIQGVAIGLGDEAGAQGMSAATEPGLPALTLYVAEPTSVEHVKSVLVESMGVTAAGSRDVPMNVVVTGVIDAQPHRFRIRPAPGGVSVAHLRVTAGTIGCLSVGRSAPRNSRLMILSNNHVLANSNNAVFGDCVCQPGPADGGRCPNDQIAILERFVPINFSGGANFVDCATAWCWPDRVRRELVFLSGGAPAFFRISNAPVAPSLGMAVGKSGRTTQVTSGRITGVGATVSVNYGAGRVGLFRDQIAIRAASGDFSAGGDSGSSIWTWNSTRNPVGLLFAGGGGVTFANRMDRAMAALDINLAT